MSFQLTHCLYFKFIYLEAQVSYLRRRDYSKPNLNGRLFFSRDDLHLSIFPQQWWPPQFFTERQPQNVRNPKEISFLVE